MQCCSGGGNDAAPAGNNIVNCTYALNNAAYTTPCPGDGSGSVDQENGIEMEYSPCPKYTGVVTVTCVIKRASDDYSGAGPGSVVSSGSLTFTYVPKPCGSCTAGTCDSVLGCVCPAGRFGDNCQYSSGSSVVYSAGLILAAALLAIATAL